MLLNLTSVKPCYVHVLQRKPLNVIPSRNNFISCKNNYVLTVRVNISNERTPVLISIIELIAREIRLLSCCNISNVSLRLKNVIFNYIILKYITHSRFQRNQLQLTFHVDPTTLAVYATHRWIFFSIGLRIHTVSRYEFPFGILMRRRAHNGPPYKFTLNEAEDSVDPPMNIVGSINERDDLPGSFMVWWTRHSWWYQSLAWIFIRKWCRLSEIGDLVLTMRRQSTSADAPTTWGSLSQSQLLKSESFTRSAVLSVRL